MKNTLKFLSLASLVLLASCSKDENSDGGDELDQAIEVLEQTPLEANTVNDNVIIAGSTKNDGVPPTPNNAISLDVSNSSQTAFLGEGFDISLNSDADIIGAYLIFKSNDGTTADGYYDITLSGSSSFKNDGYKFLNSRKRKANVALKQNAETVDVDFNTNIKPGTFCYEICVYDAQGNISAPQEVCVTVEAWGGNSNIVSTWNLTKQEDLEGDVTVELMVGEQFCYSENLFCDNQETLPYEECYEIESASITFTSNGAFSYSFVGKDIGIDYLASSEQCVIIEEVYEYSIEVTGYWAYVTDEKRLTLVAYEIEETSNGESETEVLNAGEGELIFDGTAEINGNNMVITETEDFDGDGVADYTYKTYLQK